MATRARDLLATVCTAREALDLNVRVRMPVHVPVYGHLGFDVVRGASADEASWVLARSRELDRERREREPLRLVQYRLPAHFVTASSIIFSNFVAASSASLTMSGLSFGSTVGSGALLRFASSSDVDRRPICASA